MKKWIVTLTCIFAMFGCGVDPNSTSEDMKQNQEVWAQYVSYCQNLVQKRETLLADTTLTQSDIDAVKTMGCWKYKGPNLSVNFGDSGVNLFWTLNAVYKINPDVLTNDYFTMGSYTRAMQGYVVIDRVDNNLVTSLTLFEVNINGTLSDPTPKSGRILMTYLYINDTDRYNLNRIPMPLRFIAQKEKDFYPAFFASNPTFDIHLNNQVVDLSASEVPILRYNDLNYLPGYFVEDNGTTLGYYTHLSEQEGSFLVNSTLESPNQNLIYRVDYSTQPTQTTGSISDFNFPFVIPAQN